MTEYMRAYLKPLLTIALPIILQNFLSSFVNMLDTIMVGQLGSVEIAAVGLGNQIFFLLNFILTGTITGGAIFISQYWGKKDMPGVHRTMGITFVMAFVISVFFFAVAYFAPEQCLRIYTEDEAVISVGIGYLKKASWSYLFYGFGLPFAVSERSTERVKLPMWATGLSVVFNGILNYLLIFGVNIGGVQYIPEMGVVGAAFATVVSRIIEFLLLAIVPFVRRYEIAAGFKAYFTREPGFLRKFVKVCLPVLINETVWSLGITTHNIIYGHAGTEIVAALNINSSFSNLIWTFFMGTGAATGILIGKKIGEGGYDEARKQARVYALFMAGTSVIASFILVPLSKLLPLLYNVEPEVIKMATGMLHMLIIFWPLSAFNMCMAKGVCRAGGDTVYGAFMDAGFMWLISIPLGFLAILKWNLPYWGIYMCIRSEEFLKMIMGAIRLKSGKWLHDVT
ncbi:MAG: MATE family efflux transporter [Treponema sp.]|nr:MATE family efflux transporter [Candidatus Treponema caballi]